LVVVVVHNIIRIQVGEVARKKFIESKWSVGSEGTKNDTLKTFMN